MLVLVGVVSIVVQLLMVLLVKLNLLLEMLDLVSELRATVAFTHLHPIFLGSLCECPECTMTLG